MPFIGIEVYPTCEIHLLIAQQDIPMRVIVREIYRTDSNLCPQIEVLNLDDSDFQSDLVTWRKDDNYIEFSPNSLKGNVYGKFRYTEIIEGETNRIFHEVLFQVLVHQDIRKLWIGNNRATLYQGQSNYVLSVFAQFNDGSIGDISSHLFLTFTTEEGEGYFSINEEGRITGDRETRETERPVYVSYGGNSKMTKVRILSPLETSKPILRCVEGSGNMENTENILFLAEGYTESERGEFEFQVTQIIDRIRFSPAHSPFNYLEGKFNFWTAFDPSPENGITISDFIDVHNGELLQNKEDRDSIDPNTSEGYSDYHLRLLQARDSKYGLIYGSRYGDGYSHILSQDDAQLSRENWHKNIFPFSLIDFDRRRNNLDWKFWKFIDQYIDSLQIDSNHLPIPSNFSVDIWKSENLERSENGGRNKKLVCFIVNDQLGGGVSGGKKFDGIRISSKLNSDFIGIQGPIEERHLHPVGHLEAEIDEVDTYQAWDHIQRGNRGNNIDAITSTFVHELGHAFGLGDEYEAVRQIYKIKDLQEDHHSTKDKIDHYPNLTHTWRIERDDNNGSPIELIDPEKIVWNKWHMIEDSVTLIDDLIPNSSDCLDSTSSTDRIEVLVDTFETSLVFWRQEYSGRGAFLRSRVINFDNTDEEVFIRGPFEIQSVDFQNGRIILIGCNDKTFPIGSVIYVPKLYEDEPLPLIHPGIYRELALGYSFQRDIEESEPNPCEIASVDPGYAPHISGLRYQNKYYVIGLYEGGGTINCNVYRPSGHCKMRSSKDGNNFPPFCFVCKYHLVNKINPNKFWAIANDYPNVETIPDE